MARKICNGMWVAAEINGERRIGIAQEVNDLNAEMHLVDDDGTTSLVLKGVPVIELAQAKHNDIPEPRRPALDLARSLGYA